jgi:3-phosphoshikimate 1-carboxyvinyltransferase
MSRLVVKPATAFDLRIDTIAPDKSISHRCAIFAMLSDKPSTIRNYLQAEDTLNTLEIVKGLGATVEYFDAQIRIVPPQKIKEPANILDCGNSGTAIRLFMGFLASREGFFVLFGDKYLASRPMKRVADPLRSIGAKIDGRENGNLAPVAVRGVEDLKGFVYQSPVASAQVKSAMILAALNAQTPSFYSEPHLSRDHSERMLHGMGAKIEAKGEGIEIHPMTAPLSPLEITIPADPSSAFFFAVAAAIVPGSRVVLENLSLNPTRIEAYKVLEKMGAKVTYRQKEDKYEPIGDIVVEYAPLHAVTVKEHIAWLIDELPALSIAMAYAEGRSVVENAAELRVKESDRIKSVVENLQHCGIETEEFDDGYSVTGSRMHEAVIDSHGDHRIAMSFAIAGLTCGMQIEDIDCIRTSFPNFTDILSRISEVQSGD